MQEHFFLYSKRRLNIWFHYRFYSAYLRVVHKFRYINLFSFSIELECFQDNIHSNLVSKLEAIGKGFFWVIYSDYFVVYFVVYFVIPYSRLVTGTEEPVYFGWRNIYS